MLLYVVLGVAVFATSGQTTGTPKRSIFGPRQRAPVVPFKVELCQAENFGVRAAMPIVLVHVRVGGIMQTKLLTFDDNGDIQEKERDICNGCDLVAVDKNGRLWKSRSVIFAAVMDSTNPCPMAALPIRSQSMVMSPKGEFVVFFFGKSPFAEMYSINGAKQKSFELGAFPLTAVSFRGDEDLNAVWVALTNGNVVELSIAREAPFDFFIDEITVPDTDQIAVFRVRTDVIFVRQIAYMRALRERSIYVCELRGDKCTELRTNGPVVADFQWLSDDQILCRTVTGSMFVWNVVELFYKELEGVEFENVSAFTCSGGRVYIAYMFSDESFEVTNVPDIDWTQGGDASVERSATRRVAFFARHPQAEHNVDGIWGVIALFSANSKVTAEGLKQLRELRQGMRALTVDETADKQAYDELHDAERVYVAMSPLVRAVWAAVYALDGIYDGQIVENYTVYIHGALQANPPVYKTTMADACGPIQWVSGVKIAAITGFGETVDGRRMLDRVQINEDYNSAEVTYTYDAKQLLTEVRDSQAADEKVLFAAGHSQWFQDFINDGKLQLDAISQQFRDDLNANQSGKLHNCQVVRFEYEVTADGSIQMWDCRSVFTPNTQTR